jgi:hypothetical protein
MEARSTKSRVHHLLEEILNEYIVAADLQSVNSIGNGSDRTGRALTRYNTWAAIRKRAKATGVLTPRRMSHLAGNRHHALPLENDGRLRERSADGGAQLGHRHAVL